MEIFSREAQAHSGNGDPNNLHFLQWQRLAGILRRVVGRVPNKIAECPNFSSKSACGRVKFETALELTRLSHGNNVYIVR
jgi:hypothetical protein